MPLIEFDRHLLERCLARKPGAWKDFVDKFMGLVVHVVNHSAQARSIRLLPEDRDDLCGDVFLAIVRDDFAVLRRFRGQSSLATYLAVVARRVVVKRLLEQKSPARLADISAAVTANGPASAGHASAGGAERNAEEREEVQKLLDRVSGDELAAVRMYYLEGKTYAEIAQALGLAENSVGPLLSRARQRMRAELDAKSATR